MHGNGHGEIAQLRAEVAELRAALEVHGKHLELEWRPRLLAIEQDVDVLIELLGAGARTFADELRDFHEQVRRDRAHRKETT